VTTAVLAAAVAAGAYVEPRPLPLVGVAGLLVVLVALGWPGMLRLPAPGGSRLVVLLSGFGAAAATWYTPSEPVLRHLPMIIAIAFVLAFLAEMMRRDGRRRRHGTVHRSNTAAHNQPRADAVDRAAGMSKHQRTDRAG
jgi:hypothetical protein